MLRGLAGEWDMLERLNHPVIMRGFDAVLDGPRPHIVVEHLEGPRLSSLVRRYGPLPAEQLVPLGVQLGISRPLPDQRGDRAPRHQAVEHDHGRAAADDRLQRGAHAPTKLRTLTGTVGHGCVHGTGAVRSQSAWGPSGTAADVWGLGSDALSGGDRRAAVLEAGRRRDAPREERWPQLVERGAAARGPIPHGRQGRDHVNASRSIPPTGPRPPSSSDQLEPVLGALPKPRLSKLKPRLGR